MRLILTAPHVAFRDCGHCLKFMYDEKTGEPVMRRGKPVPRPKQTPAPCRTEDGCPKGKPTGQPGCLALSPANEAAYVHYRRCKAVGRFPEDSIVERNAMLIAAAEESAQATLRGRQLGPLAPLISLLGRGA